METKQTAVEWLVEKMSQYNFEMEVVRDKYIPEAIQMEKEQIMDSYEYGNCDWEFGIYIKGEQYYNQTYGNNSSNTTYKLK
jgi:hypothetical protein